MSAITRAFSAWMAYVNTEIQLSNRQGRSSTFNFYLFRFNSFTPTLAMSRRFFVLWRTLVIAGLVTKWI